MWPLWSLMCPDANGYPDDPHLSSPLSLPGCHPNRTSLSLSRPPCLPLLESSHSNLLVYTFPNSFRAGWPSSICVCGIKFQKHPKVPKVSCQLCGLVNLFSYWTLKALNRTSSWFGFAFVHWFFCLHFTLNLEKRFCWKRNENPEQEQSKVLKDTSFTVIDFEMQGWYWHWYENISNNTTSHRTTKHIHSYPLLPVHLLFS